MCVCSHIHVCLCVCVSCAEENSLGPETQLAVSHLIGTGIGIQVYYENGKCS